ncbi:MAG: protein kinase [Specibacter sp.]
MSSRRAPAAPPVLPGYRFVSVLGSGGFSDVYLYEQDRPRRKVAVKVLTADLKTDGARASFESEANLMAQLSAHPYIVTIFEAEITDSGHSYLAMEYCSRPSLDMQYRQGRFSADKALEIGIQVASAVETAHRAGIAHRDIKPANILVTDYNRPALTDFGISGTMDAVQAEGGGMSIPWSPPESFGSGATDGIKVDVWALGATIYTLLAGHSPFVIPGADNSQRELIARINSAPLPALGRADLPQALELVLATAMAKSPASRYGSAKDFARALMRIQADLNLSVTPFEVREDVVVADSHPDDLSEPTRVRSVVSIDPDASTSNPTFPSRQGSSTPRAGAFTAAPHVNTVPGVTGSTTGLNRNGLTLPSAGAPVPAAPTAGPPTQWHDSFPVPANQAPAGSPAPGSFVLDSTVQRSELLPPGHDLTASAAPAAPGRKRLWLGLGSGLVLVAAVVVGIVVFLNVGSATVDPQAQKSSAPPTALIIGADVPAVTDLYPIPALGGWDWTWSNPDPQAGDKYLWASVSAVDTGTFKPITDNRVFLMDDSNGETCISVKLVRKNGQTSAESKKCS